MAAAALARRVKDRAVAAWFFLARFSRLAVELDQGLVYAQAQAAQAFQALRLIPVERQTAVVFL